MSAAATQHAEYFGDSKLLFRVRQFVKEQRAQRLPVTDEACARHLLATCREYTRKPQGPFKKSVAKALRCALDGGTAQLQQPQEQPQYQRQQQPQRRRKRPRQLDARTAAEEILSSDEEAARAEEEAMQSGGGGGHNLLNQSMRDGYRRSAVDGAGSSGGGGGSQSGATGDAIQPKTPTSRTADRRGGSGRASGDPRHSAKKPRPGGGGGSSNSGGRASGFEAADTLVERPHERYSDLGGISGVLQEVRELIEYPLMHPEVYSHLGIEPPRGILLHGPPGCGKTLLAHAIAGELGVAFLRISAPEIVSGMSGESEQKVRELFAAAADAAPAILFVDEVDAIAAKRDSSARGMEKRIVAQMLTCMDSLGSLGGGGSYSGGSNRRSVVVIGATNRPNDLDPALRRAGRFDREICLGVPDQIARARILRVMTSRMRLSGEFDFDDIARRTPGYVGADLSSLTKEAAVVAINRIFGGLHGSAGGAAAATSPPSDATAARHAHVAAAAVAGGGAASEAAVPAAAGGDDAAGGDGCGSSYMDIADGARSGSGEAVAASLPSADEVSGIDEEAAAVPAALAIAGMPLPASSSTLTEEQLAPLCVTMADFVEAVGKVQPSAKREGFATAPDVSWGDVGALAEVREELSLSLLEPIACPERYRRLGLSMPSGVLLYGPPGCGKTLLAKAVARESGANFISIKGPELLDKYVGESERAVRQVFLRAAASSPCIVFFDELDALCPRRGGSGGSSEGGGGVSERVVNQLLTEMDGLDARRGVYVVAATNRPELIDPAMLRPGRLDKLLYVPLPDAADRVGILRAVARGIVLADDVDLEAIARHPRAEGFSGADLSALVREAGLDVLRRLRVAEAQRGTQVYDEPAATRISAANFEAAFARTLPSVSAGDRRFYQGMQHRLRRARAHAPAAPPDGGEPAGNSELVPGGGETGSGGRRGDAAAVTVEAMGSVAAGST